MTRKLPVTISGLEFDPLAPTVDLFRAEDIAHSLAGQARYLRHTRETYPVAQHCVILSYLVEDVADAPKMLMHEVAEPYIGDISAAVLDLPMMAPLRALHDLWTITGFQAFGLTGDWPDHLRALDEQIRVNEARDLFVHVPRWAREGEPVPAQKKAIVPWTAAKAKANFLQRFYELFPVQPAEVRA